MQNQLHPLFYAVNFQNNNRYITNNIFVDTALVIVSATLFFIAVFPIHFLNYVFISTEKGYASVNVTLYGIYRIVNFNTDDKIKRVLKRRKKKLENARAARHGKGNEEKMPMPPTRLIRLYNKLCITKIIQLGDYGIQNENNVYVALAQKLLTDAIYAFVKINGGSKTKLRNYAVFNCEHGNINYYLKLVGVINVISLLRLLVTFLWEKVEHEYKIKKVAKRRAV